MNLAIQNQIYCIYCEEPFDPEGDDIHPVRSGFWCSCCDWFNFFDPSQDTRKFTLVLEENSSINEPPPVKKRIKLNKRMSPLRYPGAKSKVADHIYQFISAGKTEMLASPYAGGASAELAFLHAGVFQKLALNDKDFGVYSLFQLIKTFPEALTMEIQNAKPTHDDYIQARQIIKNDYIGCDLFQAAWSLLLVNRLAFSGIFKANPLGGIRGNRKTMLSRWNPEDLCKRINTIHAMSDRFTVHNQDAIEFIEEYYWYDNATLLIDAPYVKQGKNLYLHYYEEEDHLKLQLLLEGLYQEFPCADLIVTYDNDPLIEEIYKFPEITRIKRRFSA
ncbi:DNA adenine methylase [Paenibacillus peoriae]|uniref:DNA adenine methylase n=1 Tax=Paenibacillus peoriae TaxID=59893 RepID=UPI000760CAD0|nr:DNA adenine methylase [Paenibacillus peoriae]